MDGRLTWTDSDEAGDYVVPNVLSPRDLVSRPDMDETVPHTEQYPIYDETMQSRSLLEGKTTKLKQFLKSIILTPRISNKSIAFLFVLSILR